MSWPRIPDERLLPARYAGPWRAATRKCSGAWRNSGQPASLPAPLRLSHGIFEPSQPDVLGGEVRVCIRPVRRKPRGVLQFLGGRLELTAFRQLQRGYECTDRLPRRWMPQLRHGYRSARPGFLLGRAQIDRLLAAAGMR